MPSWFILCTRPHLSHECLPYRRPEEVERATANPAFIYFSHPTQLQSERRSISAILLPPVHAAAPSSRLPPFETSSNYYRIQVEEIKIRTSSDSGQLDPTLYFHGERLQGPPPHCFILTVLSMPFYPALEGTKGAPACSHWVKPLHPAGGACGIPLPLQISHSFSPFTYSSIPSTPTITIYFVPLGCRGT